MAKLTKDIDLYFFNSNADILPGSAVFSRKDGFPFIGASYTSAVSGLYMGYQLQISMLKVEPIIMFY